MPVRHGHTDFAVLVHRVAAPSTSGDEASLLQPPHHAPRCFGGCQLSLSTVDSSCLAGIDIGVGDDGADRPGKDRIEILVDADDLLFDSAAAPSGKEPEVAL